MATPEGAHVAFSTDTTQFAPIAPRRTAIKKETRIDFGDLSRGREMSDLADSGQQDPSGEETSGQSRRRAGRSGGRAGGGAARRAERTALRNDPVPRITRDIPNLSLIHI